MQAEQKKATAQMTNWAEMPPAVSLIHTLDERLDFELMDLDSDFKLKRREYSVREVINTLQQFVNLVLTDSHVLNALKDWRADYPSPFSKVQFRLGPELFDVFAEMVFTATEVDIRDLQHAEDTDQDDQWETAFITRTVLNVAGQLNDSETDKERWGILEELLILFRDAEKWRALYAWSPTDPSPFLGIRETVSAELFEHFKQEFLKLADYEAAFFSELFFTFR